MAISAADVKKLREMTGSGMMDCKKALTATEGDFDKAIELDPNDASAYNNRADLWLINGEFNKALDDINVGIKKNNSDFVSYVTRAEIYLAMDLPEKGILDLDHALSINNDIKDAYENRAKCFRNLAESEEDPTKKAELIAKAEADEKKAESLKKEEKK